MTQVAAGARLVGWALDRDTTNAVEIDVYEGPCQVYACTLKGLTTALEDARIWSFRGTRGLLALGRSWSPITGLTAAGSRIGTPSRPRTRPRSP
jgi:hypothetical protein